MECISNEQIEYVTSLASKIGIDTYKREMQQAKKREASDKKRKTKQMLSNYKRIKTQLEQTASFTEEEKAEYRWKFIEDLMGNSNGASYKSDRIIEDEERKRKENLYTLHWLENSLTLYRQECELAINDEERRRYRVIEKMYLLDSPMNPDEIAESENISRRTVFRDIDTAVTILSIYLFGVKN